MSAATLSRWTLYTEHIGARGTQGKHGETETFFVPFKSLPFDNEAAEICGRIRAALEATGTPIGPYDLQIAANALANNLTLGDAQYTRVQPGSWPTIGGLGNLKDACEEK